jgi:hypothetical protein
MRSFSSADPPGSGVGASGGAPPREAPVNAAPSGSSNPFADESAPATLNPLAARDNVGGARALDALPPPNPFAADGAPNPFPFSDAPAASPVQLLPKPARLTRASERAIPAELDWAAPAEAPADGSGAAAALNWARASVRNVAGAVAGAVAAGIGDGGGGAPVPRGAGAAIEWGAPPGDSGDQEEGRAAADSRARGGGGGDDDAEDANTPAWASRSPSAEAERASRAADLALKKVLEWLAPGSIAASLFSALLGVAGIVTPWYGHSVSGEDNCEVWYSQVSFGWEGTCSATTKADNPQFGVVNVLVFDPSFGMLSAAVISSFGVVFGFLAVASAALQRVAALRLASPRAEPPPACSSACTLLTLASLEFACTTLGAVMAGAIFERLVNNNALIAVDTFGGGRSIADAAVALAAVAVIFALLSRHRLRLHAQTAKLDPDRKKAEKLLGLPAQAKNCCC